MDACVCHLCGEAMEPDMVMAQGDTCELCYLAIVIPAEELRRHGGLGQAVAAETEAPAT